MRGEVDQQDGMFVYSQPADRVPATDLFPGGGA